MTKAGFIDENFVGHTSKKNSDNIDFIGIQPSGGESEKLFKKTKSASPPKGTASAKPTQMKKKVVAVVKKAATEAQAKKAAVASHKIVTHRF